MSSVSRHTVRFVRMAALTAAGFLAVLAAHAAPEPKVSVEFSVTNGNQLLVAPAEVLLSADAFARQQNHPIAAVEFYNGAVLIATASASPYAAVWAGVPAGSYTLTAKAINDKGDFAVSPPIPVLVDAPPSVALTQPASGSVVQAGATLQLAATAADPDGAVARVEFFAGGVLVGTATSPPYSVTWSNVPAGAHVLSATATDNLGATVSSAPISVSVNAPPLISLTSPTPNQIVRAPGTIALAATATDADGSITQVAFHANGALVGTATVAPFLFNWTNVPAGAYSLTAVATDDRGGQSTSAPVPVTLDAPPTVSLTSPTPGTVAIAPATLTLSAMAADPDGSVASVAFFNGASVLATTTTAPYVFEWAGVQPGSYSLTAVATDSLGVQTTSVPVNVSVVVNHAPTVALTSPASGLTEKAPATISLAATATDEDNNLVKVEFFQNGNLLQTLLSPPYTYEWANVPQGSYSITAVATDALGAQATSVPASVSVTAAQASLYFIYPDHLGTPRLVTDEQSRTVWRQLPTTDPFGNAPPEEDPDGNGLRFEMPLAFPGQLRDRESNLFYNYFRDYDPGTGRYVQSDPIGLDGGINTYSYVDGNPLSWTDALGLSKGGKKNLGTEGFNKNSDPKDVEDKMNEARRNGQSERYKALRALLKVIKRGGTMGIIWGVCEEYQRCTVDPCSCDPNSSACLIQTVVAPPDA